MPKAPNERIPRGTRQPKRTLGQRARKATQEEVEKRIRVVADMIAVKHLPDSVIRKALYQQFGIKWRQADRYMARARKYILEHSGKDKDAHVAEAYTFYESVMRDPDATRADKFTAQREIRQLLGLDSPKRVAQTTPDGAGVSSQINMLIEQMPDDKLQVLRELRRQVLAQAAGQRLETDQGGDGKPVANDSADGDAFADS